MPRHGHSRADARNLALHRAALEKMSGSPALRAKALALVERWLGDAALASSRRWLETWREMLTSWTPDALRVEVLDEERGQALRQCSPLAPVLTPRERWAVLKAVNEGLDREERGAAR